MTRYNWAIANLEHNVADGGVIVAHWHVTVEEGDYTASAYGTAGFKPDPTAAGFVPYADLIEADVLAWVWASVDKHEMEANLAKQIEDQKAPATQSGLPWA
jgi:hypothetical protein